MAALCLPVDVFIFYKEGFCILLVDASREFGHYIILYNSCLFISQEPLGPVGTLLALVKNFIYLNFWENRCIHRRSWGGAGGALAPPLEKLVSLAGQKWDLGRTEMGAWQDRNGSLAGQK